MEKLSTRHIWILPAILAFLIALIPTINYQWPLSWDIIIHVQYAMVYAKYGLVLTDPLLNAPFGQKIGYPPLFHLLLVAIGAVTRIDYFQVARALQPFLAMFIVLSVSYVARKFYGTIAGISAGFLVLSSVLIGRILLPIPENLALIFLPLSIYFYYRSIKENLPKYALLSGILFIVIILTHQVAGLILFLIISVLSLVELIVYRNTRIFKFYGAFLLLLGCLMVVGILYLLIFQPDILYSSLNQGISAVTGIIPSISYNRPLNIRGYLDIGYLVLIFAFIGIVFSLNKMRKKDSNEIGKKHPFSKKDLFILTWIVLMFLLSIAYWFGINVISYRLLVYLLIPLSIIGGFGLSELYERMKTYKRFSLDKLRVVLLLSVFILGAASGVLTVEDPDFATFKVENQYGSVEIAPPSASMVDLADWFYANGDKNRSILTNNLFTGTFLAAASGMPVHYGFEDFNKNMSQSAIKEAKIGYLVLD
ncbi:MAG TPA: hypothetical protein VGC02_04845, partial [Methanobacterium sp.]